MIRSALLLSLLLGGCASFHVNTPLRHVDDGGYRFAALGRGPGNTDETLVVVAISGGGLRASAFAYGVLQEMDATRVGGPTSTATLLDEVDVMSAVSGGSFAAAYYGVHGKSGFLRMFRENVLNRNIQAGVIVRLLQPWNLVRLMSRRLSRADIADEYCDDKIFEHKTFANLSKERPLIVLSATDLNAGASLAFTQDDFDRLCSDLSSTPISRAVVASTSDPLLFAPVVLTNYPKASCGYEPPAWVSSAMHEAELKPQRYRRAQVWHGYERSDVKFVYLMDGRLADPRALNDIEWSLTSPDSKWSFVDDINRGRIKRIVLITVDSSPARERLVDSLNVVPELIPQLDAAVWAVNANTSARSLEILRQRFAQWTDTATAMLLGEMQGVRQCGAAAAQVCQGRRGCEARVVNACRHALQETIRNTRQPPAIYFINVRADAIADAESRIRAEAVRSSFVLSPADADLMVDLGRRALRGSLGFQRLVQDLATGTDGDWRHEAASP